MRVLKSVSFWMIFMVAHVLLAGDVTINEIMYNSPGDTDIEWVELTNNSGAAVDLSGWYLIDDNDGHTHCVLSGTLAAGAYLVVARIVYQFQVAYPTVTNVFSTGFGAASDAWALSNSGEAVRLFDSTGQLRDIVEYQDGGDWPGGADGDGPSLELLNPNYDNALATAWRSSSADGGTPGKVNSVYTDNAAPVCKDGFRSIDLPTHAETVAVSAFAYDHEGLNSVNLMVNTGSGYTAIAMADDGLNGDAVSGDSVFTAVIPAQNSGVLVKYYVIVQDQIGQTDTWPNNAPDEYKAYTIDYAPPALMITEALASNQSGKKDEAGEYDDWFEIYNNDSKTVNLAGMFVSSSLDNSQAFELPDVDLDPGEYLLVWADDDTEQGSLHADFKLSASGEDVALFETIDHGNVLIHGWSFGVMTPDISMGFPSVLSNTAPEYLKTPTPGATNETSALFSDVCINEFQSTSNFGGDDDWVEIYNRGNAAFDLSGCFLSDDLGELTKWTFPQNTILLPGAHLVIYEDALGFSFSSTGDEVIVLTAADSLTGLDYFDYDEQTADHSQGRYPDGSSRWYFFANPTKGEANANPSEIETAQNNLPTEICLYQNYPNPFNPSTTISFLLPSEQNVRVAIYDMLGKEIALVADERLTVGRHVFRWNAEDQPCGIYFYRLTVGSVRKTGKMILLK
ncbi:MAG: lamin tail domain-containing protein [Candidatus Neomarinimicrobiota bacterium]